MDGTTAPTGARWKRAVPGIRRIVRLAPRMIGKTVLHYKVEARLGQGGMGEVYRAQDTRLGREVALKFLPASYHYDLDRRSRFFQEARVLSSLQSPNIAAIYDIGEFEDTSFIVMELVRGDTVASRLHRGPL